MKKRIHIEEIQPLKDSYKVSEGYFESLLGKIDAKKGEMGLLIRLEDISPVEESFKVPEGYFEGLMDKIEERKELEDNVVSFRSRRIKIWGAFVAAACIAMVVVSVINLGPETAVTPPIATDTRLKNVSDTEIASLLTERDDEFELTDEEIIEVIVHETTKDESTAIIDFLEEDVTGNEDFLEEI